ncbi:hypothetical protein VNO77_34080 [Canavalia gladiata]|uniref:Uncharacterized protein n=1 Tax=Canavalia gladiata TaxID=3824 RepID=A0AAN9PZI0_CANGL
MGQDEGIIPKSEGIAGRVMGTKIFRVRPSCEDLGERCPTFLEMPWSLDKVNLVEHSIAALSPEDSPLFKGQGRSRLSALSWKGKVHFCMLL